MLTKSKPLPFLVTNRTRRLIKHFNLNTLKMNLSKITKLTLFLSFLFSCSLQAQMLSDQLQFSARMDGDQEAPAVTTTAMGVASLMLNQNMDSICIDISANDLSGAITGIHIHEAMMGMNGPVVVDLTSGINGNRVTMQVAVSDSMLQKMMMGMYYLNLHTAANPSGEIRGQIKLETDDLYSAWCDTMQQNHMVMGTTNPMGLATFHLNSNREKMQVNFVGSDFSGAITAAHLHYGAMGEDGPVAINLSSMINGNTIMGDFDPMSVAGFLDSLMMNKVYLNVHTTLNASGEVRGQLMMQEGLTFDMKLDTMQQNHMVMGANPMGTAYIRLNETMDSIWYDAYIDGLSGTATMAHVHQGYMGMDGGVLVDLSNGISGNRISGWAAASPANIMAMLRGETYVNVHTSMNAAGELRGQVWKQARDGYNMWLNGDQQVPAISVSGTGAGIVSIDRDRTNAHVMVVVSDLTAALTGAHFHAAPAGENGSVIYDLTSWFAATGTDDSAFGYWTENDATTPFGSNEASLFWNDSIYINVHTTANAGGELRGQATMMTYCSNMMTSTTTIPTYLNEVQVFPNPTSGNLNIQLESTSATSLQIRVSDILGKTVLQKTQDVFEGGQLLNLDLHTIDNGLYLITIQEGDYIATFKVFKQ